MITEDQGLLMLRRANPVPETEIDAEVSDVRLHQAIEQRGSEVTQLSTQEEETPKRNRTSLAWLAAAAVVVLIGAVIILFSQGVEEPPPATDVVPTTVAPPTTTALPSTTVAESALADIPVWLGRGDGQFTPPKSKIPYAFTNAEGWNSFSVTTSEERFSVCPGVPGSNSFSKCHLASVSIHFLDYETIEETRDFLATFDGAELGEEQQIEIDGASGIRFEFTHEIAPLVGQVQGALEVPEAVGQGNDSTPLGQGPLGRSIVSIVDVDGVVVTLVFQGFDVSRGAAEDGFSTYKDDGLGIIDSIIWGTP